MTQLTDNVIAIPIPSMAFGIMTNNYGTHSELITKPLPPGSYEFLFTTDGASEEDARKVVKELEAGYKGYDVNNDDVLFWREATQSLSSLLRSKSLEGNHAIIKLRIERL